MQSHHSHHRGEKTPLDYVKNDITLVLTNLETAHKAGSHHDPERFVVTIQRIEHEIKDLIRNLKALHHTHPHVQKAIDAIEEASIEIRKARQLKDSSHLKNILADIALAKRNIHELEEEVHHNQRHLQRRDAVKRKK